MTEIMSPAKAHPSMALVPPCAQPHNSPCPHQVAWLASNVGQQSSQGGVLSQAAPRQARQLVPNGLRALGGQALQLLGGDEPFQAGGQARTACWRHPARQ